MSGATCIEPRGLGESCTIDACDPRLDGELCRADTCADDLYCNASESGVCAARPEVGETCDGFRRCAEGSPYCVDGRCDTNPEGAVCSSALARRVPDCPEGFRCDEFFRCERVRELGESCERSSQCSYSDRCLGGICLKVVLPGEACGPEALCPGTFVCRDGICQPLPVAGGSCDSQMPCIDSVCVDGRCGFREVGRACGNATECVGRCNDGSCEAAGELGDECTGGLGDSCGEGLLCDGRNCIATCPVPG